jgi:hypothetical protein
MSSTGTNKQPLLIDRPLIEVEVLTTAAVGDRNQDTYKVQGGQGPILLVDMDRTLTDDDISGGVIDTIEIIRNEASPDADLFIRASGAASSISYSTGVIVEVEEDFFVPSTILSLQTPATVVATIDEYESPTLITLASGDLIQISSVLSTPTPINESNAGEEITISQYDYLLVTEESIVVDPATSLPSGIGLYQYTGLNDITVAPEDIIYTTASGMQYLGAQPGTAFSQTGYFLYSGPGVTFYGAVAALTEDNGFTNLGTNTVFYKEPITFNPNELVQITTNAFLNSPGQMPNSTGIYQYTGEFSLSARPDTISFTPGNGFVFLGQTPGSHPSGPGFYQYRNSNSISLVDRTTSLTELNGFVFLGTSLEQTFEPLEICFYHVRQKVNPLANDGDYKFIGVVKLPEDKSRVDGLASLPHMSVPVPNVSGTLNDDIPGKNRGLFLQRGDAIYVGLYASKNTSINYTPGVTVIAQGGYY